MSKPIEPGVRAYFGWWSEAGKGTEHCRCSLGYVKDGPYPPGVYSLSSGRYVWNDSTKWNVQTDDGTGFALDENYIYPIDDGDDGNVTEDEDCGTTERV